MKAFPKEIYVRRAEGDSGDVWFEVAETVGACIEDDGPTAIGVYQLVRKVRAKKVVSVKP